MVQDPWKLKFKQQRKLKNKGGQSYKDSTIVIYDSRVLPDLKMPHIMTLDL